MVTSMLHYKFILSEINKQNKKQKFDLKFNGHQLLSTTHFFELVFLHAKYSKLMLKAKK